MSKILVTGGCGMIGSNLVKRLVKEGHDVSVIDNLWRGKLEYLNDESGRPVIDTASRFFNIDLSKESEETDAIVAANEYVIHMADIVAGIDYVFGNRATSSVRTISSTPIFSTPCARPERRKSKV